MENKAKYIIFKLHNLNYYHPVRHMEDRTHSASPTLKNSPLPETTKSESIFQVHAGSQWQRHQDESPGNPAFNPRLHRPAQDAPSKSKTKQKRKEGFSIVHVPGIVSPSLLHCSPTLHPSDVVLPGSSHPEESAFYILTASLSPERPITT